jgi:Protein of unknown function (DUF3073)
MGRGRQKAKQTKVARQLKYFSPDTDYDALQRELGAGDNGVPRSGGADPEFAERAPYGGDDDDGYGSWTSDRRG